MFLRSFQQTLQELPHPVIGKDFFESHLKNMFQRTDGSTPLKINMEPQTSPIWEGKSSEPNLH